MNTKTSGKKEAKLYKGTEKFLEKQIPSAEEEKKHKKHHKVIKVKHLKPRTSLQEKNLELYKKTKSLVLSKERDIAMDFAAKVYKSFSEMIKAVILFGSSAKRVSVPESDIDIIIIIDDVLIKWDQALINWYREELAKIIENTAYKNSLHINTVKLSTWWDDMLKGDPIVINIIRHGDSLIDVGGFFGPLKVLLEQGKIKSTPEAIYTLLERAPTHLARTRAALLVAVDGLYWAMVDSAHAAIIAARVMPPSPEEIAPILQEKFVKTKMLHPAYIQHYINIHNIAKEIIHGKRTVVAGKDIDAWLQIADSFIGEMARIIKILVEKRD